MAGAPKPKISVNVFERDLGYTHIMAELEKIKLKPFVKAGITQAKGSRVREDGKLTTAEIARVHEYGSPSRSIPERSFMRSTLAKNQNKYDRQIAELRDQIFDAGLKMGVRRLLGIIGQSFVADVKGTIRAGIAPKLSQATIERKNARKIAEAKERINKFHVDRDNRGYRETQKASGVSGPMGPNYREGSVSVKQKQRFDRDVNTVITGGASTALIDTGQMINAISYEVVMDGRNYVKGEGEI
jgi:hypothetical protein